MRAVDFKDIFEQGQDENIQAYLNFLDPLEIADLFCMVNEEYYPKILGKLDTQTLAAVFPFFEKGLFEKLVNLLDNFDLTNVFNELETDDAAYLLRMFRRDRREELLHDLEKNEQILKILSYPKESAGSIMQTEVCLLRERMLIKEAIESIRSQKRLLGEVFNVYVIDRERRLVGLIHLDDLILGRFSDPISQIMKPIKHSVHPEEDQEEVAFTFSKYDLGCLPVVDDSDVLLGQITYDDIQDVIEEEASEDLLAFAGVNLEESVADLDQNKMRLALGRFPWLIFSISASLLTGYILTFFEKQTSNAIIFASFVPLIMNTTGNVGTQTAMIITRNFALGANEFGQFRLPLMREFAVGFFLGCMAGVLTFALVLLVYGDIYIAFRVGITLVASMTSAALFGMFIPIGFKKVGIDPAIASGPLVTSGCDLLSVGLYLIVVILLKGFW